MQFSTRYIIIFSVVLCLVSSTALSVAAVVLRNRQELNAQLDKQKSVLLAAKLMEPGDSLSAEEVLDRFSHIEAKVVDLESGKYVEGIDAAAWSFEDAPRVKPPANPAQIQEVPTQTQVFLVKEGDQVQQLVLPIYGKGLWSTMWGYLALDQDTTTVRGITFYKHGETPGLGGEIDNPKWKSRWSGRKIFDENGEVAIHVIKGAAGPPEQAPHEVDGLSGATITSRGVTYTLDFWLGPTGFGPYLKNFREGTL